MTEQNSRIRLNNKKLYIDGRWVGHISVSGNTYYGALPGTLFSGASQMEVAEQMVTAMDAMAEDEREG